MTQLSKVNFLIAIGVFVLALIIPVFLEKFIYANKSNEAISIAQMVQKVQNLNYINFNQYIDIQKGDIEKLQDKFSIKEGDILYYDYSIFTTYNSYTLYAEPKIKYLKSREIAPKIYVYSKVLNEEPLMEWK
jgi:hypothetical protein